MARTELRPGDQEAALEVLLGALDLETVERDLFRGTTPPTRLQRIFGGQVAAQALVAAGRTVADQPDRPERPAQVVHSLHAYFLRPGDPSRPVVYEVDRIRDGQSYATRRVVGVQNGRAIFNLQASFHRPERGYDHQLAFPGGGTHPDDLPVWRPRYETATDDDPLPSPSLPFELRVAPAVDGYTRLLWFRTVAPIPGDPMLQACVAAYASDLTLLTVAVEAAGAGPGPPTFVASLDHAMWFHRPFRVDEWMLYAQSSPSASDGRGLTQGHMFGVDGSLAISVVQEGAIRPPRR